MYENYNKMERLIHLHKRELGGEVAGMVDGFDFEMGMVARAGISAVRLSETSSVLFAAAPVLGLSIKDVAELRSVLADPALAQLVRLGIRGNGVDDETAFAIARGKPLRDLRILDLQAGTITDRGLQALQSSKALPNLITIVLTGNPCRSSVMMNEDRAYWIAPAGEAFLDKAQRRAVVSYNPASVDWPPVFDEYAWTD